MPVRLRCSRRLPRNLGALLLACLVAAAASLLQLEDGGLSSPLDALDSAAHDMLLRTRSPESYIAGGQLRDPREVLTIVAIDERTIDELGAYNGGYPRRYHAQVVEQLLAAAPRVIAIDVGFFEPTADDPVLAEAFDHARGLPVPTRIVLGAVGILSRDQLPPVGPDGEISFVRALRPVPILAERAELALANLFPDDRGAVRSMPLLTRVGDTELPTLGLATTARYLRRPSLIDGRDGPSTLVLAGRRIPIDHRNAVRINYFGPPGTFRVVSFVDVLRGHVDPELWRGGMVLVGAFGATGLADDYWTPASEQGRKMAGVEIHANVAATLLSNEFLRDTSAPLQVASIFGLALLIASLAANLPVLIASALTLVVVVVYGLGNAVALGTFGVFLPLALPEFTALCCFGCVASMRLIAEQREGRALLDRLASVRDEGARQARQDALTGLANRTGLHERLEQALAMPDQPFSLLLLDLDRFKDVNDSLGYTAGDLLLREVSRRLRGMAGPARCAARVGGDEFAVLLPGLEGQQAEHVGLRLLDELEAPAVLDGQEVAIRASIGIATYPAHGAEPEALLRRAELAMYSAKQTRVGVALYRPEHEQETSQRLALVSSLRQAIAGDELVLFYQPKVECRSRRVEGFEALVRWQHPRLGLVLPDRFIPLAEEAGLIDAVTRWVLDAAVRQWQTWRSAGMDLSLSVNLSAFDLQDPALPTFLGRLLSASGFPAQALTLEITETAVLREPARALDVLRQLRALGVRASLDDFGTGYSSLAYLQQLPVNELKIERSFVRELAHEARDQAIVRSTIQLGHSLGLTVVAEGVEDKTTLDLLAGLGCDQAQGYLLGRPMPAAEVRRWLRASDLAA